MLHTPDGGRTWIVSSTPSRLPLDAMSFADDEHGWAVGAMGIVLATDDGGRTWRVQRAGGGRAAFLGLFCREGDVPWELLARLAGDEGYLSVVDLVGRGDVEIAPREEAPLADRLHEASLSAGGCGAEAAWQFPLRQPGLLLSREQVVEGWDRFHNGRGLEDLAAYLDAADSPLAAGRRRCLDSRRTWRRRCPSGPLPGCLRTCWPARPIPTPSRRRSSVSVRDKHC